MNILGKIFGKRSQSTGQLRHLGLTGWWNSAFSPAERDYLEAALRTLVLPANSKSLTKGREPTAFQTAASLLTALADQLSERAQDRDLASRVLAKAEHRALAEDDTLGLHFVYDQMIRLHSHWNDTFADARDLAFAACRKQVRLAPQAARALRQRHPGERLPTHLGYLLASVTLEQVEAYEPAIELCRRAQSEGWTGDWPLRILQLNKKLCENGWAMKPIAPSGLTRL